METQQKKSTLNEEASIANQSIQIQVDNNNGELSLIAGRPLTLAEEVRNIIRKLWS